MLVNRSLKIPTYTLYIVVNDGTRDNTSALCRGHSYNFIGQPINLGLTGAFEAGAKCACRNGFDAALQFNAGGQIEEFARRGDLSPEPDAPAFPIRRKRARIVERQVSMRDRAAGESCLALSKSMGYMKSAVVSIPFPQLFRR